MCTHNLRQRNHPFHHLSLIYFTLLSFFVFCFAAENRDVAKAAGAIEVLQPLEKNANKMINAKITSALAILRTK